MVFNFDIDFHMVIKVVLYFHDKIFSYKYMCLRQHNNYALHVKEQVSIHMEPLTPKDPNHEPLHLNLQPLHQNP